MRILALIVVVAGLISALWLSQQAAEPLHVSGFIEAHEIRVGSRVGGRVRSVHVEEGQTVRKGDTLVELESFDLEEQLARLTAERDALRADLDKLEAGFRAEDVAQAKARRDRIAARLAQLEAGPRTREIDAARSRRELADAQLVFARLEFERIRELAERELRSEGDLDRATRALRVAEATLAVRQSELSLLEEGTRPEEIEQAKSELAEADAAWQLMRAGFRSEEIAAARAAVKSADASIAALQRRIAELSVQAPIDGVVESLELRPGDLVPADGPMLSLLDPTRLWVRAYVPENRLTLALEDRVEVSVDSFPEERFVARIGFIARRAEFTPSNVQTPEERSKQVFRIKAYLEEGLDRLRPGMPADVWLEGDS